MARLPSLRASDADREQVAERLRVATAEGRLSTSELEDRLGALYASRTYGELDPLVADLPAPAPQRPARARVPKLALVAASLTVLWTVLGALARPVRSTEAISGAQTQRGDFAFRHTLPLHHAVGLIAPAMVGLTMLIAVCVVVGLLLTRSRA